MSQVIRIPSKIYFRLTQHAVGFDTPANVIEKLLNHYEGVGQESAAITPNITSMTERLFSNKEIEDKISQVARTISEDELEQLCDKRASKELFNIDVPLFIKCSKNLSEASKRNAVKDEQGISRWTWKFEFERNNFLYAITTQWYPRHDIKVKEWLHKHK